MNDANKRITMKNNHSQFDLFMQKPSRFVCCGIFVVCV